MDKLYNKVCHKCSELITKKYSTSFSMGIRLFDKEYRSPIYAVYGLVRFADEIVDTFHDRDKKKLLQEFRNETLKAIEQEVSLNPVLHSFQQVYHSYGLKIEHVEAFFDSMEMDLYKTDFTKEEYDKYIYGSAEVVGLMCLDVFVKDKTEVDRLTPYARALGSAFQKINFLRDVKSDLEVRGRTYFPGVDLSNFSQAEKLRIEEDIKKDFDKGLTGINLLPKHVRLGVYLAYVYYTNLFKKIKKSSTTTLLEKRIRVKNRKKLYLLTKTSIKHGFSIL